MFRAFHVLLVWAWFSNAVRTHFQGLMRPDFPGASELQGHGFRVPVSVLMPCRFVPKPTFISLCRFFLPLGLGFRVSGLGVRVEVRIWS